MEAKDLSQFHQLAKAWRGQITLKDLYEQEQVPYQAYYRWRNANGITWRINRKPDTLSSDIIELDVFGRPDDIFTSTRALTVHTEFENGLIYDRNDTDVDTLVVFLTKIRSALC